MIQQTEFTLRPRSYGFHLITDEVLTHLPELPEIGLLHLFILHIYFTHLCCALHQRECRSRCGRRFEACVRPVGAGTRALLHPHLRGGRRHAGACKIDFGRRFADDSHCPRTIAAGYVAGNLSLRIPSACLRTSARSNNYRLRAKFAVKSGIRSRGRCCFISPAFSETICSRCPVLEIKRNFFSLCAGFNQADWVFSTILTTFARSK